MLDRKVIEILTNSYQETSKTTYSIFCLRKTSRLLDRTALAPPLAKVCNCNQGSFGKVKIGTHKLTGQKVAIKIVGKEHAPALVREVTAI